MTFFLHFCACAGHLHGYGAGDSTADSNGDTASTETGGDTSAPPVDADGDGLPDAWADESFWHGSALDVIILPETVDSGDHWEVHLATSPDLANWTPDPRVIASPMSSLDLLIRGGRLLMAGVPDQSMFAAADPPLATYGFPVLSTTDLTNWGAAYFDVQGGTDRFVVDPSLQADDETGVRASWFAHSVAAVDPVSIAGPHDVQRAGWTGAFVQDNADPEFQAEELVDPVICPLGDAQWLFYTEAGDRVRAAESTDGGQTFDARPDVVWEGPSVPFCVDEGDSLRLVVQWPGGRKPPSTARFYPDGTLVPEADLYTDPLWSDNCTSPVIGRWGEGWVLACAVWVKAS